MLINGKNEVFMIDRDNSVFHIANLEFPFRKDPRVHLSNTLLDGVSYCVSSEIFSFIVSCKLLCLEISQVDLFPSWPGFCVPLNHQPSLPAPAALPHIIDKGCKTLGERTACFHLSAQPVNDIWLKNDRPCPGKKKNQWNPLHFCVSVASLLHTDLCCNAQRCTTQGVGRGQWLIPTCNMKLRFLLACLCCLGHTGACALRKQVDMHESSSDFCANNIWSIGDETEAIFVSALMIRVIRLKSHLAIIVDNFPIYNRNCLN